MKTDILIVAQTWPDAFRGGTEYQAFALSEALARDEYNVQVWTRRFPGNKRPAGVAFNEFGSSTLSFALLIMLRLRRYSPSVVFAPLISSHSWALARTLPPDARLFVKVDGGGLSGDIARSLSRPWGRKKLNDVFKRAQKLIVPDESIISELISAGCDKDKIVIIPNSVDLDRFTPSETKKNIALFMGRLRKEKGADYLPQIWKKSSPGSILRIVGNGPLRLELEAWAASRTDVELSDFTSDVVSEYQQARVLLLPSRFEGLSNVLLEALASGVNVIASDIPSNRRVASDCPGACRILPLDDFNHWQKVIEKVMQTPVTVDRAALEPYSFKIMMERYKELFVP